MPTWFIALTSVIFGIVIMWGAVMFPLVPMLFGLYDEERHTLRGRILFISICLFPLVFIYCIYVAWTTNGYYALVPYPYILFLWLFRLNKVTGNARSRYTSKQENLEDGQIWIDRGWPEWRDINSTGKTYVLFKFFAPNNEEAAKLQGQLEQANELFEPISANSNDNKSVRVHVRIKLVSIDKQMIMDMTTRMVDMAWNSHCELSDLDVMEKLS